MLSLRRMLRQWKAVLVWLLLTSRASQCAPQFCMPRAGSCLGQLAEFRRSFEMPFNIDSNDFPVPVMVDDWDGDGADDLLLTIRTHTWYFHGTADQKLVPVEESKSPFRDIQEFYAGRSSFYVHALDWDRDSNLDLAVCSTNFTHLFVDFWRREQDSSLSLNYSIPMADLPSFTLSFVCTAMQLVDWDADGDLDLLVSTLPLSPSKVEAGMYFMEAAGLLDYKPYNKSTDPFQGLLSIVVKLQAVDWDGDGDLEMLATDIKGAVHLFEHLDNGHPKELDEHPLTWGELNLKHLVDLDKDGLLDVLLFERNLRNADFSHYSIQVWIQEKLNELRPHLRDTSPFQSELFSVDPYSLLQVLDWDGDTRWDLLSVTSYKDSAAVIKLQRQTSAGSFTPKVLCRVSSVDVDRFAFQGGDWDEDGVPDILIWTSLGMKLLVDFSGDECVMRNTSLGPPASASRMLCQAMDADSDGDVDFYCVEQDLAGAVEQANPHLVYFRNESGQLTTAVRTPVCQSEVVRNLQLVNDTAASGAGNVTLALLCAQFPISNAASVLRAAGPPETVAHNLQKLPEWSKRLVYPLFVDWDRDGEMEAIGVDLTGGSRLQYYSAGHCVSAPRCHGGTCNPNGQCTCPRGTSLPDCSACQRNYASGEEDRCLPCPGVGRGRHGTCAGRGTCRDDIFAADEAKKAHASNMSVLLARGPGCKCSNHFNGTSCKEGQCPAGYELVTNKMQPDSCKPCLPGYFKAQPGNHACQAVLSFAVLVVVILNLSLLTACVLAGGLLPVMLGHRIPIQEISNTGHGVRVTTVRGHWVRPRLAATKVYFEGTGVHTLDTKPGNGPCHTVRTVDRYTLQLHGKDGSAWEGVAETSCGWLWLPWQEALLATGFWCAPTVTLVGLLLSIPFVVLTMTRVYDVDIAWLPALAGGLVCPLLVASYRGPRAAKHTALRKAQSAFLRQLRLGQPKPVPRERGPSRAITLGQLCELHQAFQGFIQDRSMHYVCHNLVKPLTREAQLSYAEVAGPHEVEYFVSHYWGTPFRDFVSSVWKHSEAIVHVDGQLGLEITRTRYWICTVSNNQWEVECELGGGGTAGWEESSFYMALRASGTRGTAMILDEEATPLKRSWCLFELFQTFQLSEQDASFQFLFCTPSGVLNYGNCSVDAAIAISDRLVSLRLEDAEASYASDKDMIDQLISQEEGGFDAVNFSLKLRISEVLRATERHLGGELGRLNRSLEATMKGYMSQRATQEQARGPPAQALQERAPAGRPHIIAL